MATRRTKQLEDELLTPQDVTELMQLADALVAAPEQSRNILAATIYRTNPVASFVLHHAASKLLYRLRAEVVQTVGLAELKDAALILALRATPVLLVANHIVARTRCVSGKKKKKK